MTFERGFVFGWPGEVSQNGWVECTRAVGEGAGAIITTLTPAWSQPFGVGIGCCWSSGEEARVLRRISSLHPPPGPNVAELCRSVIGGGLPATSIIFGGDKDIFVATKHVFCLNKTMPVATTVYLSRQNFCDFCCDKIMFVVTNMFVVTKCLTSA